MTMQTLAFEDLEKVYEALAAAVDEAGAGKEALLLSKLCLTLAHRLGDLRQVEEAIEIARQDLQR